MPKQTDDTKGFPRLPFDPTPPPDLVSQALATFNDNPAEAMRRIVAIFVQHLGLQQQNNDYSARFWGKADVAEQASEHWNYVRNGDFVLGTNGDWKWANNAALTRAITTAGLPYGLRRALVLGNSVGTKNWVQQSVSATGATWYNLDGWARVTTGTRCGFEVVENSGSSPARTHAQRFPGDSIWQRLGDHRNPGGLTFKTYRGTTRLTVRCVLSSSNAAQFAEVALEKGRRRHPWRHHILDRGNYITSAKTAGSASFSGNLVFSASGGAAIRQAATKKFIWGAPKVTSDATKQVSATGAVGTLVTYSRADHVHRGVNAIKYGTVSIDGAVGFSASGTGSAIRTSGQKVIVGPPKPATATPAASSTSGAVGTGTLWSRTDHRHRGVKSIGTAGSASFAGAVRVSASGGAAIRQVAGPPRKLVFGAPTRGAATPNPVSATAAVGSSVLYSRQDHVHRGVKAIKYGTTSNDGTVQFSGSGTGGALAWSGAKLKLGWPKPATATPTASSTSGAVGTGTLWSRTDHRHRGVKAIRVRGAQGSASGTVRFSQSSNTTVRRSGSTVIVGTTGGGGVTERCRVFNSAAISITNATLTALTFDSERFDTDTMHSTVTNTGRITFTTAGRYLVIANVEWQANGTGQRILGIRLNGVTMIAETRFVAAASANHQLIASTIYDFAAADYVEARVYQDSGAALNVQVDGNISPEFMAHRMS